MSTPVPDDPPGAPHDDLDELAGQCIAEFGAVEDVGLGIAQALAAIRAKYPEDVRRRASRYVRRRASQPAPPSPPCEYAERGAETPSCAPLLESFREVMLDPVRWPAHICAGVAAASVIEWRRLVVLRDHDERLSERLVRNLGKEWPLWIGPLSLPRLPWKQHLHKKSKRDPWGHIRNVPLPPTNGSEVAIFAVRVQFLGCSLDLLGISMDTRWDPDVPCGPLLYDLRGENVPKEALRVLRAAKRWWAEQLQWKVLSGSANAGRPKGSYKGSVWSRDQILDWWIDASASYVDEGTQPTQRDLANAMGVKDGQTVRGRVDLAGLSWPPSAADVEAHRRRRDEREDDAPDLR